MTSSTSIYDGDYLGNKMEGNVRGESEFHEEAVDVRARFMI